MEQQNVFAGYIDIIVLDLAMGFLNQFGSKFSFSVISEL
jgi:hypothetical protein